MTEAQRLPAEETFRAELEALVQDDGPRPEGWHLTPRAVVTYLLGGDAPDGTTVSPKYIGDRRRMESAVATLATDRALLLLGVPGTGKSWVSELLAAAISGDSTLVVQGTAGTDENQVRYGWNYAQLLAHGPSEEALVKTPLYRAMEAGQVCRFEELTRLGSDVQDTLITVLSERMLPIPELDQRLLARRGFNVIATANNRDKGVNELSSALKRRFNVVVLPLPGDMASEVAIVQKRVAELGEGLKLPMPERVEAEIERVITIFRELRSGRTLDGKMALKAPTTVPSTAEAIAVVVGGLSQAVWFADGELGAEALAPSLLGAILKDPVQDRVVLEEYIETVLKKRRDYADYYLQLSRML
ncbi:MAG: AAA family ATPase [Sandaracinaceae bacterium]